MSHLLFLDFSGGEILLIAVVFLMFFGSKSIPDIARTAGKAIREFKEAANSVQRDIQESSGINEIKESLNPSPDKQAEQSHIKPQPSIPAKTEEQKSEGNTVRTAFINCTYLCIAITT